MPKIERLPSGCAAIRGSSDIRRLTNLGGDLARQANRLYMLTVRRESLVNKKNTLEYRLKEIKQKLRQIEKEMNASEAEYRGGLGKKVRRKNGKKNGRANQHEERAGRKTKTRRLSY